MSRSVGTPEKPFLVSGSIASSIGMTAKVVVAELSLPDRSAAHARKVEVISAELRRRRSHRPVSLKKRTVSHQVPKAGDLKHSDERIDVSELDAILEIDPRAAAVRR